MRPSSSSSSSMGDCGQMYHGSIVTEFIFSNQLMMERQNFTPICGCIIAKHYVREFSEKKECRIIDMSKYSILTLFTNLIFHLGH